MGEDQLAEAQAMAGSGAYMASLAYVDVESTEDKNLFDDASAQATAGNVREALATAERIEEEPVRVVALAKIAAIQLGIGYELHAWW